MKKVNSKDLPQGWTKEKVAMAYHMAGQRGGKGTFLKMWKDKYAFKLSQQKARVWETKYVLERNDTSN